MNVSHILEDLKTVACERNWMSLQDQNLNPARKHENNSEKEQTPPSLSDDHVQQISTSPILCKCGRPASEKVAGNKNVNKGLRYVTCANYVPFFMKKKLKGELLKESGTSCRFFRWLDPPRVSYEDIKQAKAEKRIAKEHDAEKKRQLKPFATRAAVKNENSSLQAEEVEGSPAICSRVVLKKRREAEALQNNVQHTEGHTKHKKNLRTTEEVGTIVAETIGSGSALLDTTSGKTNGHGIHANHTSCPTDNPLHIYSASNEDSSIVTLQEVARTDHLEESEGAGFLHSTATKNCSSYFPNESTHSSYVSPCTKMMKATDAHMQKPQAVQCKENGNHARNVVKVVSVIKTDGVVAGKASSDAIETMLCNCKKEAVLKKVKKKTDSHGRLYWVCPDAVNPFQKNKSKAAKEACRFFRWMDDPTIDKEEHASKKPRQS